MSLPNSGDALKNLDQAAVSVVRGNIPDKNITYPQTKIAEHDQFFSDIKLYLTKRKSNGNLDSHGDCIFVYISMDSVQAVGSFDNVINRFQKNMSFELTNKLFICLGSGFNRVAFIDFSTEDNPWNAMTDYLDNLEQRLSCNLIHIVYSFNALSLELFVGVDSNSAMRSHNLNENVIRYSQEDFEAFADKFHHKETMYPTSWLGIWESPADYKLMPRAEDHIVLRFVAYLEDSIGSQNVIYESTKSSGRPDIVIHDSALVGVDGPCVMEFKVLRHGTSHRDNRRWALKGILQARDYSKDWDAGCSYVMTYDGRSDRSPLEYVDKVASRYNVLFKNYTMYNSSSNQRAEEVIKIEQDLSK